MGQNREQLFFRQANSTDIEAILRVQLKAFKIYTKLFSACQIPPLNESTEQLQNDLNHKTILVACMKGNIVGSVRYKIILGVCHLERLRHLEINKRPVFLFVISAVAIGA